MRRGSEEYGEYPPQIQMSSSLERGQYLENERSLKTNVFSTAQPNLSVVLTDTFLF